MPRCRQIKFPQILLPNGILPFFLKKLHMKGAHACGASATWPDSTQCSCVDLYSESFLNWKADHRDQRDIIVTPGCSSMMRRLICITFVSSPS